MPTAKEMFRALGYDKFTTIEGYIVYAHSCESRFDDDEAIMYYPKNITFNLDEKIVNFEYTGITKEEFEASIKQCEELGWIEFAEVNG